MADNYIKTVYIAKRALCTPVKLSSSTIRDCNHRLEMGGKFQFQSLNGKQKMLLLSQHFYYRSMNIERHLLLLESHQHYLNLIFDNAYELYEQEFNQKHELRYSIEAIDRLL